MWRRRNANRPRRTRHPRPGRVRCPVADWRPCVCGVTRSRPVCSQSVITQKSSSIPLAAVADAIVTSKNWKGSRFSASVPTDCHNPYYVRVAPFILPHLKDRPVTLKRYPDGVTGEAYWRKNAPNFTPEWVQIFPVPRHAGGPDIDYVIRTPPRSLGTIKKIAPYWGVEPRKLQPVERVPRSDAFAADVRLNVIASHCTMKAENPVLA